MKNNETLKKQIIYRSSHRGSKEMDLLLGNFVMSCINFLNEEDLTDLNNIVSLDDETLKKWYFEDTQENLVPKNKISKLLKEFKF